VDIARGEMVEAELDAMIRRRDEKRRQSEGERLEEELWQESERKHVARRREENRIAWCAYYRNIAGALYARAEEYIVRAEKLENGARKETA
jgi:hypothetical protein